MYQLSLPQDSCEDGYSLWEIEEEIVGLQSPDALQWPLQHLARLISTTIHSNTPCSNASSYPEDMKKGVKTVASNA